MKWKTIYLFPIGLLISINCLFVIKLYSNPYPCQISCIGCSSLFEMFIDNLLSIIFGLIMISGFILMYFSVTRSINGN